MIDSEFMVYTNHNPLISLRNKRDPHRRLARWTMVLQNFKFELIYRKGKENMDTDFMSRIEVNAIDVSYNLNVVLRQEEDPLLKQIKMVLKSGVYENETKKIQNLVKECYINKKNDALYCIWRPSGDFNHLSYHQIAVPRTMTLTILKVVHEDLGHLDSDAHLTQFEEDFIDSCVHCARKKAVTRKNYGVSMLLILNQPWELVEVDITGPLPRTNTGKRFILVFIDHFTRWPEAIALNGLL